MRSAGRRLLRVALLATLLAGCGDKGSYQLMAQGPRYEPLEGGDEGAARRPPLADTVARGQLNDDDLLHTGMVDGREADVFPFPVTTEVLARGRERFDIFCSPCHGRDGYGDGMVVQRGFTAPPSFHTDRLRASPAGHFVHVMTAGYGAMPTYAKQIPPHDRWAIAAYLRALQLSQHATLADVPPEDRTPLAGAPASGAATGTGDRR
jgi:mono/diheme cytochrome c family protein